MRNCNANNNHSNQKPLILAIETSGRLGSVAIAAGRQLLAETTFSAPMMHSAEIFAAIQSLLALLNRKPKEIEHIYISVGPGSFTGLRIAVTIAKTMHLANATKTVAVDTMDVIAANAISLTTQNIAQGSIHDSRFTSYERIATILDAKRGQFFVAVYKRQESTADNAENKPIKLWQKILPASLMTTSQFRAKFADTNHPVWLLGEGLVYHKDKFKADGVRFLLERYWSPRAGNVHLLGWEMAQAGKFTDPLTLQPTYLRRPEAEEKFNHKKTRS